MTGVQLETKFCIHFIFIIIIIIIIISFCVKMTFGSLISVIVLFFLNSKSNKSTDTLYCQKYWVAPF